MKTRLISLAAMITLALASVPPIQADTPPKTKARKCRFGCGGPTTKVYDLATSNVTGDQIRGPATVQADNLNLLRYDYKFNVTITFSAAPDLFRKLQAAVTAAAAAPPADANQVLQEKASLLKAQSQLTPGTSKNTQVNDIVKKADKAWQDAQTAVGVAETLVNAARGSVVADACTLSGTGSDITISSMRQGSDITGETNRQGGCLDILVSMNADSTNKVKIAGQALVALLQKSWTTPDLLVGYIEATLKTNPESSFMAGISAPWPPPNKTAILKQSALAWKAELADRTLKFNNGLAPISGALTTAKTALENMQPTLIVTAGKVSSADQAVLDAERQKLQTEANLVDNAMKQLTATTSLLNWAAAENQRVLGAIPDLEASGTKYSDFQAAQAALIGWKTRTSDLQDRWKDYKDSNGAKPNPFSLSSPPGDCGFAFATTKTTAITLSRIDLMPGTTATTSETVLSVSVQCTSPFTVSAGVAFSTIPKHQFAIQQGFPATPPATGTVSEFVVTDNSNFHPLPIGMVHARFCEFNETIALHASFGMAGNFQSASAGGSNAEFLLGPSVSLFRTMFFTPGLYIGTKASLAPGFSVGGTVPVTVTQVPVQTSYTTGFGFAITFTKP